MDSTTLEFLGIMFLSFLGFGVFIWIVWVTTGVKVGDENLQDIEKEVESCKTQIQALKMQVNLTTTDLKKIEEAMKE
jgi:hypothetical protein